MQLVFKYMMWSNLRQLRTLRLLKELSHPPLQICLLEEEDLRSLTEIEIRALSSQAKD